MNDYWVWLDQLSGVSLSKKTELLTKFKTPREIFLADYSDINHIITNKESYVFGFTQVKLDQAKAMQEKHSRLEIKHITPESPQYKSGSGILTYYKGSLGKGSSCAVIGTRSCSAFGIHFTKMVCDELSAHKICINSGLARGIDKWAHTYALTNKAGATQAFVATGLDTCYPREHAKLLAKIIESGAAISPFPCGIKPLRHNFLIRNKLMGIWSDRVVVIEAPKKSGALITAEYARNLGREVFTINPQSQSRFCEGNRILLANGAKEFTFHTPDNYVDGLAQNKILNLIKKSKISMGDLKVRAGMPFSKIEESLLELELENLISFKSDGNWHYNGW